MSTTTQETCASVQGVTDVLTRLGDALASGDLDAMLAAEPLLAELAHVLAQSTASPADRDALLPELAAARIALVRAARLGEGITRFKHASDYAQGLASGYDRAGRTSHREAAGALKARG
jgi:hypothetical protein